MPFKIRLIPTTLSMPGRQKRTACGERTRPHRSEDKGDYERMGFWCGLVDDKCRNTRGN